MLYVAVTRAKDQLALITPQRFYVQQQSRSGDRHVFASRTRFIPSAIMEVFEARAWPVVTRNTTEQSVAAPIDLQARMRGVWRKTGT